MQLINASSLSASSAQHLLASAADLAADLTAKARAASNNSDPVVVQAASGIAAGSALALLLFKLTRRVPKLHVPLEPLEASDAPQINAKVDPAMPLKLAERPGKLQCWDPCTAQHLGEVDDMTPEQVTEACLRAKAAQVKWAKTGFATRRRFLEILLKYTVDEMKTICRVSMRDSGKVEIDATLGEIVPTVEKLRWMIREGEAVLKPSARFGQGLLTAHKTARVEYKPVGVLAVFAPFNYPFTNLMNHIISGVFAGNGCVNKVSEFTSWSASLYLRVVRAALVEVGGDPDLVQVITGTAPAGAALASSPHIDKIIFTGSDAIGKIIMKQASDHLTPCVLELGGKDPFIVFADTDLDRVAAVCARGCFQNAGQNCIGIDRVFVERKALTGLVDRMVAITKKIRLGKPFSSKPADLGCICTPPQLKHVDALIKDAVSKGAVLHFGGERDMSLAPGLFYKPTIISGITKDMDIAFKEIFGPVCAIQVFDTEAELVAKVNDNPYALGSSVFSGDHKRATRIAGCIQAGMCNINDFGVNYLVQSLPFGGIKASGYGRFAGAEGLRACCYPFAITDDAFPGIETNLPPPFKYPCATNAPDTARGLIKLAYGETVFQRLGGLIGLLGGLIFAKWD